MERHGGGGGDGNGDEKCEGCGELDLELSLAPPELRERPAEDPLPPVHVSQELRELLPPQSEQYQQQQQQQESISPSPSLLPLEQRQPSLSSKKSVLFRKLQALRSSRISHKHHQARTQIRRTDRIFSVRRIRRTGLAASPNAHRGRPSPIPLGGRPPATVRPINWLRANGITHVHGEVRCGSCGVQKVVSYELESKVGDTRDFMYSLRHYLDDHVQPVWSKAKLLPCDSCGGSGCVGPVIPARDEDINWLFMLLGQTLAALSLAQLKNFCGKTRIHRTGTKSRLLFNAYVELCRQLIPDWKINTDQKRPSLEQMIKNLVVDTRDLNSNPS
uniref:DUF7086 domain-containing protein n=1 Tax=Ananas comosus var. bracteatus TaxID=296719 RepID=A0A6V7PCF2_ANACO|nr:unnamed protein product [Ananas comosus var. bracteatus]